MPGAIAVDSVCLIIPKSMTYQKPLHMEGGATPAHEGCGGWLKKAAHFPDRPHGKRLRIGHKDIPVLPNLAHSGHRTRITFGVHVRMSPSPTASCYSTPRIPLSTLNDFGRQCVERGMPVRQNVVLHIDVYRRFDDRPITIPFRGMSIYRTTHSDRTNTSQGNEH